MIIVRVDIVLQLSIACNQVWASESTMQCEIDWDQTTNFDRDISQYNYWW